MSGTLLQSKRCEEYIFHWRCCKILIQPLLADQIVGAVHILSLKLKKRFSLFVLPTAVMAAANTDTAQFWPKTSLSFLWNLVTPNSQKKKNMYGLCKLTFYHSTWLAKTIAPLQCRAAVFVTYYQLIYPAFSKIKFRQPSGVFSSYSFLDNETSKVYLKFVQYNTVGDQKKWIT